VPAFEQLALPGLAAAHDVTDPLLGLRRDADRGEVARAVEMGELRGVVTVVANRPPLRWWPGRCGMSDGAITPQAWPHSVIAR